jgi:hypothetical protein
VFRLEGLANKQTSVALSKLIYLAVGQFAIATCRTNTHIGRRTRARRKADAGRCVRRRVGGIGAFAAGLLARRIDARERHRVLRELDVARRFVVHREARAVVLAVALIGRAGVELAEAVADATESGGAIQTWHCRTASGASRATL